MSRSPLFLSASLAMALLAGCSSLIGGPKETPRLFAPVYHGQPAADWPQVTWSLVTARSNGARLLDGQGIVVSPVPGELQVYRAALWARTPGDMVEDAVLRTLEASGNIAAVAPQSSGMDADYRLLLDIREFRADYAGNAVPAATVEINAKLLHLSDQSIVGSRSFHRAQTATDTDVASVALAFGQTLDSLAPEIAGWALQTGQAHELAAHKEPPRR